MPRISQLDPLTGLSHLDMFEVTQRANNKSCSITAQEMGNYFKTLQNGGFRGSTSKSLNDFTMADVGVWHWTGTDNVLPLTEAIIEIVGYVVPDSDASDDRFLMKVSYQEYVYQRGFNGQWSEWSDLRNRNGCRIEYGHTTDTHVSWTEPFRSVPAVIAVPLNQASSGFACFVNVYNVSVNGFDAFKFKSNLTAEAGSETTTVQEDGSGTKTTRTTTDVTRGAWEADDGIDFYWIAISDYMV